jgi:hypothetical protein
MAAEAVANPTPNADLRSILFIAFLLRLPQRAAAEAARNMPSYRIQSHTRHKSAQMVAGYIREADKWTKSGLDGVGF